jgi:hypothetical protein
VEVENDSVIWTNNRLIIGRLMLLQKQWSG